MRKKQDPNLIRLGQNIRKLRKQKTGLSQEKFAAEAGIDRSFMGQIERGESNISILKLCLIAKALKVKVKEVTEGLPINVDRNKKSK